MARLVSVWFEEMEEGSISLVTPTVHSLRSENRFVEQGMPFTADCLENPDHPFPSSPSPSSVLLHGHQVQLPQFSDHVFKGALSLFCTNPFLSGFWACWRYMTSLPTIITCSIFSATMTQVNIHGGSGA